MIPRALSLDSVETTRKSWDQTERNSKVDGANLLEGTCGLIRCKNVRRDGSIHLSAANISPEVVKKQQKKPALHKKLRRRESGALP